MKTSKKLAALFLSLTILLILTACDIGQGAKSGRSLRIAICTTPNTVDDGSFNEDIYNGILAFIASRGDVDTVIPLQETSNATDTAVQVVANVLDDYDVLVCAGSQFGGIGALAQDNPDKNFILVDSFPFDETGAELELDNVYAMQFAEQESGFFAGIAAALETQTGKVAVVNGVAVPSNVNYQFGFESGVHYANKNLGASAEIVELSSYSGVDATGASVGGNYTGDFGDPTAGKTIGQALINEGCDIIFVAAGNSGDGIFNAAKEAVGVKVIGCDVDQYNGNESIILTSVLKNMAINVERQLNAIADGTFQGGNVTLQADTDSTGYVSAAGHHQLSTDTLKALADVYLLVKSGTIVPASSLNGIPPESFQ